MKIYNRFKDKLEIRLKCFRFLKELESNLHLIGDGYLIKRKVMPYSIFLTSLKDLETELHQLDTYLEKKKYLYESHRTHAVCLAHVTIWNILHLIRPKNLKYAYRLATAYEKARMPYDAERLYKTIVKNAKSKESIATNSYFKLARLSWLSNKYDYAIECLDRNRDKKSEHQRLLWLSDNCVRNGIKLLENGGFETGGMVILGGLLENGLEMTTAKKIVAIYRLAAGDDSADDIFNDRTMPINNKRRTCKPIILSGFGWSGTGAVFDYLKGFSNIGLLFNGRENGFWSGNIGLHDLYLSFKNNHKSTKKLLHFLAYYCFGHSSPWRNYKKSKNIGGLWNNVDESRRTPFLSSLYEFVKIITVGNSSTLDLWRGFSCSLMDYFIEPEKDYVLLNNCIASEKVESIKFFEEPIVIVVWRNPYDAYISKKMALPGINLEEIHFAKQLQRRVEKYTKTKKELVKESWFWMDIWFEEFVLNQLKREEMIQILSLDLHENNTKGFDPQFSEKNINIGARFSQKQLYENLHNKIKDAKDLNDSLNLCSKYYNLDSIC